MSPGAGMSSMWWGGGQLAVGAAGQPPAPLMHRPMMGPAHQHQVGQIGRAPIEPVDQMVAFTPGQGAGTTREPAAAVADGQGGALGGLDDPAGPADLQRLGRGTTQDRREQGHGRSQLLTHPVAVPPLGLGWWPRSG